MSNILPMIAKMLFEKVFGNHEETLKFLMEVIIIYVIIRFRHKIKQPVIELPENIKTDLISNFEPSELLEEPPIDFIPKKDYSREYLDLASYDCFQIGNKFKNESKKIINEYGIGTCGPPTFYGTLDLHLTLQNKISEVLETEDSILYSNSYTCIHSVISCFSTKNDVIFYHKNANEAIIRGIELSKSKCYDFDSFDMLGNLLSLYNSKKSNNYVIIEGLSKNDGQIADLPKVMLFKEKFDIKIILVESLSLPFLDRKGLCGHYNIPPTSIDIRIGSFSYGFTSCGGFFTGDRQLTNYQKLNSSSYVFSASLPGVLANFNKFAIDIPFDYQLLRKKIKMFHKSFVSNKYKIISDILSPIILIRFKKETSIKQMLSTFHKVIEDLHKHKIYLGLNINPIPTIRLGMKIRQKNVKNLTKKILEILEKY